MSTHPVKVFQDDNFESDVLRSDVPVLVDFTATWCPPCRVLAPHVHAVAEQYEGRVKVGTLDVDTSRASADRYGVRGLPTLILFKGGAPVATIVGAVPRSKLEEMVQRHVG